MKLAPTTLIAPPLLPLQSAAGRGDAWGRAVVLLIHFFILSFLVAQDATVLLRLFFVLLRFLLALLAFLLLISCCVLLCFLLFRFFLLFTCGLFFLCFYTVTGVVSLSYRKKKKIPVYVLTWSDMLLTQKLYCKVYDLQCKYILKGVKLTLKTSLLRLSKGHPCFSTHTLTHTPSWGKQKHTATH